MARRTGSGRDRRRLRALLGLFFVALAIPSAVLTWQAYSRLQWEAFHHYQVLARELLGQIDRRLSDGLAKEAARPFDDYRFLVREGAPATGVGRRSPLSGFPVNSAIPGLLGHFQVDAAGRFTTPLLPDGTDSAFAIGDQELRQRRDLRERLLQLLSAPRGLAVTAPVPGPAIGPGEVVEAEQARLGPASPAPTAAAGTAARRKERARPDDADAVFETEKRSRTDRRLPIEDQAVVPEQVLGQVAFDRLSDQVRAQRPSPRREAAVANIGRVDELRLKQAYDTAATHQATEPALPTLLEQRAAPGPGRASRDVVETPPIPDRAGAPKTDAAVLPPALVRMFQGDLEPLEFAPLGHGHFVLYRKVWRAGSRYIQGAVIERDGLLRELVERPFRSAAVAGVSRLGIAFEGDILAALGGRLEGGYLTRAEELSGTLLYRGRLSTPLDRMELIFSVTRLPTGSAGTLVLWVALTLALVLSAGLVLLYRLGVKQIDLSRQQRDFVSAVSHELKTPLTSIRMYSEMLREGWADDARRRTYYAFIHDESERLSRLISNVLQLARMSRDELVVEPRPIGVVPLLDQVRSKLDGLVEQAGFTLRQDCAAATIPGRVQVDPDAFVQILINLVDNAIKFAAASEPRVIELSCRPTGDGGVEFGVRDHGPGIPRDQMKKIFRLFYRSEGELTRETVGTGIGLALVHRLTSAMGGEVDVVNREPGAEFRVRLRPAADRSTDG